MTLDSRMMFSCARQYDIIKYGQDYWNRSCSIKKIGNMKIRSMWKDPNFSDYNLNHETCTSSLSSNFLIYVHENDWPIYIVTETHTHMHAFTYRYLKRKKKKTKASLFRCNMNTPGLVDFFNLVPQLWCYGVVSPCRVGWLTLNSQLSFPSFSNF